MNGNNAILKLDLDGALRRLGLRGARGALMLALMLTSGGDLGSETVTLQTYYPALMGVFDNQISVRGDTWLAAYGDTTGSDADVGLGISPGPASPATPQAKLAVEGQSVIGSNSVTTSYSMRLTSTGGIGWQDRTSSTQGSFFYSSGADPYLYFTRESGSNLLRPRLGSANFEVPICYNKAFWRGSSQSCASGYQVIRTVSHNVYYNCPFGGGGTCGDGTMVCCEVGW